MANPKPGQPHADPAWRWMGDRALRVATGAATLARYDQLVSSNFDEIEDIIPADGSILLVFQPGAEPSADLRDALMRPVPDAPAAVGREQVIRVVFGGEAGPDLAGCAAQAGLDEAAYVQCLTAVDYTVAFLGFQPGFPYLAGLPEALAMPRRSTPRVRVAAGSVAVGGGYVGIYPAAGPGGWHVLGRSGVRLFDPAAMEPALFRPGDRVRFVAESR